MCSLSSLTLNLVKHIQKWLGPSNAIDWLSRIVINEPQQNKWTDDFFIFHVAWVLDGSITLETLACRHNGSQKHSACRIAYISYLRTWKRKLLLDKKASTFGESSF